MIEELANDFAKWWATINWGDAPTWVGAIGTTAAVLFGVHTWRSQLRKENLAEFRLVKIQFMIRGNGDSIPFHVRVEAFNSNPHPIPIICAYGWEEFWRPRALIATGDVTIPPGATAVAEVPLQRAFRERDFYVMVQGTGGEERLFSVQGKPLGFLARRVGARQRLRRAGARISALVRRLLPSRLPGTAPTNSRIARLGLYRRTFVVSASAGVIAVWRFAPYRWLVLITAGLLVAELIAFPLLGAPKLALAVALLVVALMLVGLLTHLIHTLWRLLDPNRIVVFAPDLGSSLDVVFKRRKRVSLANHGRAFRATSAPALREAVASWIEDIDGYRLDIRAQNMKVAEHYIAQFPRLRVVGHDWMGHYRLATSKSEPSGS